jgi:hypothetical protein
MISWALEALASWLKVLWVLPNLSSLLYTHNAYGGDK